MDDFHKAKFFREVSTRSNALIASQQLECKVVVSNACAAMGGNYSFMAFHTARKGKCLAPQ